MSKFLCNNNWFNFTAKRNFNLPNQKAPINRMNAEEQVRAVVPIAKQRFNASVQTVRTAHLHKRLLRALLRVRVLHDPPRQLLQQRLGMHREVHLLVVQPVQHESRLRCAARNLRHQRNVGFGVHRSGQVEMQAGSHAWNVRIKKSGG